MKYIRTKDGKIIDLIPYLEDKEINGAIRFVSKLNGGYLFIQKQAIIKQADTIEELCDCYSYGTETVRDYLVARGWKLSNLERKIYSCILTDKGFIYVAEINEKGELELLWKRRLKI